jgi:hypothetical protein
MMTGRSNLSSVVVRKIHVDRNELRRLLEVKLVDGG